jgi:hypothetical protein
MDSSYIYHDHHPDDIDLHLTAADQAEIDAHFGGPPSAPVPDEYREEERTVEGDQHQLNAVLQDALSRVHQQAQEQEQSNERRPRLTRYRRGKKDDHLTEEEKKDKLRLMNKEAAERSRQKKRKQQYVYDVCS